MHVKAIRQRSTARSTVAKHRPRAKFEFDSAAQVRITDKGIAEHLIRERQKLGIDLYDEVWDGVYVMSPIANNEHQAMAFRLGYVVSDVVPTAEGTVFVGCNVSDRVDGWEKNYRCPDVALYLITNSANDCGTHWCGGPDWLTEVLSDGDESRRKMDFYEKVGVQEVLLVDRDPWCIELYRRTKGKLTLAGKSDLDAPNVLQSAVLPLTFQLVPGVSRPVILVKHADGTRQWHV